MFETYCCMFLSTLFVGCFGLWLFSALLEDGGGPVACIVLVITIALLGCINHSIYTGEIEDRAAFEEWVEENQVNEGMVAQSIFPTRVNVNDRNNAFYVCATDGGRSQMVHLVLQENGLTKTFFVPMDRVRFTRSTSTRQHVPHVTFEYEIENLDVPADANWDWFLQRTVKLAEISCPGENGCEVVYCQ